MRGEITLLLGGVAFRLCPTFAALAKLEERSGVGLLTLARRFAAGEITLRELTALVAAGIEGAGGQVPENLGEMVMAGGMATLTPALGQFLQAALVGEDPAGKA